MPAERSRASRHLLEERRPAQRRHRVAALARALEDVALRIDLPVDVAGLARHADLELDLLVVRFELVVAERPVLDRRALRNARGAVAALRFADDLEVPGIQPPALRPVVQRRAADAVHHRMPAAGRRRRGGGAHGRRFQVGLLHRHRPAAHVVADLVGREVAPREPRARFEPDHVDAGARQRQRGDAADGAHPDDDDVGFREPSRHGGLRADWLPARRLVEALEVVGRLVIRFQLPLLHRLLIGGGHDGAHPRIADQIPADEVGVAAVVRIAERALARVVQHHREELRRAAGEPGALVPVADPPRRRSAPNPGRSATARRTACRARCARSDRAPRARPCTRAATTPARRRARDRCSAPHALPWRRDPSASLGISRATIASSRSASVAVRVSNASRAAAAARGGASAQPSAAAAFAGVSRSAGDATAAAPTNPAPLSRSRRREDPSTACARRPSALPPRGGLAGSDSIQHPSAQAITHWRDGGFRS